jgi:hypothetical protein
MSPDPETVALIAEAINEGFATAPAQPFTEYQVELAIEAGHVSEDYTFDAGQAVIDSHVARAVLAALGSRLLPRGGSSETKYQITGAIQGKRWVWMAYVRTIGEAFESALNARQDGWSDFRAEQRTITRFPDGSELVGPWLNVEEGTP